MSEDNENPSAPPPTPKSETAPMQMRNLKPDPDGMVLLGYGGRVRRDPGALATFSKLEMSPTEELPTENPPTKPSQKEEK